MNSSAFMENLRQLFAECDIDKNGSLGIEEFSTLCAKIGLNQEAALETFNRLDIDKNNRITFDEFAAGFNQYKQTSSLNQTSSQQQQLQTTVPSTTSSRLTSPQAKPGTPPQSPKLTRQNQSASSKTLLNSPASTRSSRLTPNLLNSRGRKSASPLGVMSLGSTGSSGNLIGGRSSSAGGAEQSDYNSVDSGSNYGSARGISGGGGGNDDNIKDNSMVVYSSDMIGENDFTDQMGNSGQFGSLVSSSGSLSQSRNMQDLLECVQKLQSENQILTQIFFKDKREREEYISQLGEEFDQQVRQVEERANRRAKEELESEKKRLRDMMQTERETLQHHYQTIEKMSKVLKSTNGKNDENDHIDKVRSKLEDTYLENRQLKRSLLDTKSDVAMIWKEMEKLKKQYEDKLSSAYERNNETRSECDHIKQQLTLMKDSNRKLQDASDVITNYITDKVEPVIKNAICEDDNYLSPGSKLTYSTSQGKLTSNSQSNSRRGSILSEYLNGNQNSIDGYDGSMNSADLESMGSSGPTRFEEPEERSSATSGSTASNAPKTIPRVLINERRRKLDPQLVKGEQSIKKLSSSKETSGGIDENQVTAASNSIINESKNVQKSTTQNVSQSPDVEKAELEEQKSNRTNSKSLGRHFFIGSRTQSETEIKDNKTVETDSENIKSVSLDGSDELSIEPSDGPSKATFNIILVGDSFVGKSSFAARFMEGSFVQGLISNCSIDFKTKSYKVDGTNYTVNLWDTAGQERFRSITASYFRKADGIILMYDVTDKRSYLNVRNWMSTISDTAAENVAVLLIGNKIDLRQAANKEKCVPTEEGFRLAKEYDIVFLETSVKTGTNLVPSMGKLIRLIAKNNTPVEEDKDRIKLNDKSKMFNCMPKNC